MEDEFHGDEVLAGIKAHNNQQEGEGFEQQMNFEQEIDVDVSKLELQFKWNSKCP